MNFYTHQFVSSCPNNGASIVYHLEIASVVLIQVEHIVTACKLMDNLFHEAIADQLSERFGGVQTLQGHHHGVHIRTVRDAVKPDGTLHRRVTINKTIYERGVPVADVIAHATRADTPGY